MTVLDVAYAGSMGSMMEGPIKDGAASTLAVTMHGRASGSDALAALIAGGSIAADVFVPVTPRPMQTVLKAGKAQSAVPIARTEMVIAYSPKSKYAQAFADAAAGKAGAQTWYQILQQPDVRFGRTDPTTDPQGRNIIFTMQLAEAYYKQPGLAQKILGQTVNPAQIFAEPTVQARLQSWRARRGLRVQDPAEALSRSRTSRCRRRSISATSRCAMRTQKASLELGGKTYQPEPLVYYTWPSSPAFQRMPIKAAAFVEWLSGGAQPIFRRYFYDPPTGASTLHA